MKRAQPVRRRNPRWTEEQIRQLWKAGILQFIPDIEIELHLQALPHCLVRDPDWIHLETFRLFESALGSALKPLSGRRMRISEWENYLHDIVRSAAGANEDGISKFLDAVIKYIQYRLGLPEGTVLGPENIDHKLTKAWRRLRLAGPDQLSCFLKWMRIPPSVWGDDKWRDCMLLRYDRCRMSPIKHLPGSLRSKLDQYADELRQWGIRDDLPDEEMGRFYEVVHSEGALRILMYKIAWFYLRWKLGNGSESTALMEHILKEPVTSGLFFDFVATKPASPTLGSPWFSTADAKKDFLRYLAISEGDPQETAGRVISYILRLWWWVEGDWTTPIPPDLREIWPILPLNTLYKRLEYFEPLMSAYSEELGIDRRVFQGIATAYIIASMQQAKPRRSLTKAAVFWAARILESLNPQHFDTCREWCRFYHQRLRQLEQRQRSQSTVKAELRRIYGSLQADPLLNCVFHTDVLGGKQRIRFRPGKRGADNHAINVTLAYAARQLREVWPTTSVPSITEVLRSIRDVPEEISCAVSSDYKSSPQAVDVTESSLYAYLTPIAVALFGDMGNVFNPGAVKWRCREYHDLPEIEAITSSVTRELDAVFREK